MKIGSSRKSFAINFLNDPLKVTEFPSLASLVDKVTGMALNDDYFPFTDSTLFFCLLGVVHPTRCYVRWWKRKSRLRLGCVLEGNMPTSEIWQRDNRAGHGQVLERRVWSQLRVMRWLPRSDENRNETQTEQAEVAGGQEKRQDEKWWHLAPGMWCALLTAHNPFTIIELTSYGAPTSL